MAAPAEDSKRSSVVYAFSLEAARAAADLYTTRGEQHEKFDEAVRNKQYSELDSPERCAARANRLLRGLNEVDPQSSESLTIEFSESVGRDEVSRAEVTADTVSDALLERVIGKTRDFQFVEFLEDALFASRSVGRVVTKLSGGRVGYGTGFMVSPTLLITNHHVLPTAADAARSTIEFDYQRDRLGRNLTPRSIVLDPATFFLNDKDLDFALVAVSSAGSGRPLRDYGWCPLIGATGKIIAGEPINIIQHPKGDLKQIVIRENRLLDAFDGAERFLHYEADTEPGSSGSPVFNDQWEVVALHHSGVPKKNAAGDLLKKNGKVWKKTDDPSDLDWVANEGVRVSKLVEFIGKASVTGIAKKLLTEFLNAKEPTETQSTPETKRTIGVNTAHSSNISTTESEPVADTSPNPATSVTLTIPLNITFSLGTAARHGSIAIGTTPKPSPDESTESVTIDPDYSNRPGYDSEFLGFKVPFPKLTNATRSKAFALPGVQGDAKFELKYYHYSVIFNKQRKLAFVAGVNLDSTAPFRVTRETDKWSYDPRVSPVNELQAGEDLYSANPLDRGHLVRRADAGWGHTEEEAKLANDDTFHFTNCAPQHAITNQGKKKITDRGRVIMAPPGLKLWGKLETHIAKQGTVAARKISVFNGPVFRTADQTFRGIQIPQEFWKMVVFADDAGNPSATAFVLTQAALIENLEEEFQVGEYKSVQVKIRDLESKTKLDFGPIRDWDVLEQDEANENFTGDSASVVLESVDDIIL